MDDDLSGFWIYVWLAVLAIVLVLFRLPPKYDDLKIFLGILVAFLLFTLGGPFVIKSTWDQYHALDAGKIPKIKDLSMWITLYKQFGPQAPAVFQALLYVFGVSFLGSWLREQFGKLRQKKPEPTPP